MFNIIHIFILFYCFAIISPDRCIEKNKFILLLLLSLVVVVVVFVLFYYTSMMCIIIAISIRFLKFCISFTL